jgi:hypothetical protein
MIDMDLDLARARAVALPASIRRVAACARGAMRALLDAEVALGQDPENAELRAMVARLQSRLNPT